MDKPLFKPDVPEPILEGLSKRDKWMYEQQSIHRQQNDWIILQLAEGQKRFDQADIERESMASKVSDISNRLMIIEKLKDRLSAKSSVFVMLATLIIIPILLLAIEGAFNRFWEKIWK